MLVIISHSAVFDRSLPEVGLTLEFERADRVAAIPHCECSRYLGGGPSPRRERERLYC